MGEQQTKFATSHFNEAGRRQSLAGRRQSLLLAHASGLLAHAS
jgi:hypothetical protein